MQIEQESTDVLELNSNLNATTYLDKLNQCLESSNNSLLIDGDHIFQFEKFLYYQLINFPGEIIPLFDKVTNQIVEEKFNKSLSILIQVGVVNLKTTNPVLLYESPSKCSDASLYASSFVMPLLLEYEKHFLSIFPFLSFLTT